MIFSAIIQLLVAFLNGVYATLPAWNWQLGGPPAGSGGGVDNGWCMMCFGLLSRWDRILPIHDALFPVMTASILITSAIYVLGVVKYIINLVRGAGA